MSQHLWERDFRLLWSGSAVSHFGAVGIATATPLLALQVLDSPVAAGWAMAATAVPFLLFQLPAGWLADRADRRTIMFVSQSVRLLTCCIIVVTITILDGPIWLFAPAVAVVGACTVFYGVAESATVRDIVDGLQKEVKEDDGSNRRRRAAARNEARNNAAAIAGRPLGGFLFGIWPLLPYVLDTLAVLTSILMMKGMRSPRPQRHNDLDEEMPGSPDRTWSEKLRSYTMLAHDSFLCRMLIICAIANFFFQTLFLLLLMTAHETKTPPSLVALSLSASGIGGLAGAFLAPRILRGRTPQKIVTCCMWLWVGLVLMTATAVWLREPLFGLAAWGACSLIGAHVNIALEVHKVDRVPSMFQGRITSVSRFVTGGAVPLGAASGGYLIANLAPTGAAVLAAVVMGILAFILQVFGPGDGTANYWDAR